MLTFCGILALGPNPRGQILSYEMNMKVKTFILMSSWDDHDHTKNTYLGD